MSKTIIRVISIIGAAGLLVAGAFGVRGITNSSVSAEPTMTAAVTSQDVDASLTAGIISVGSEQQIVATVAAIKENETVPVAIPDDASEDEIALIAGYSNLGICIVDSGNLNIRQEPSTDGILCGKLPKDAGCEILEILEDGAWAHIISGEIEGYSSTEYLAMGDDAIELAYELVDTVAVVTCDMLNVRTEMSLDSKVFTQMPYGEKLDIVEELEEWVKVDIDNEIGYVFKEYVEIKTELKDAMTLTEARFGEGVSDVRADLCTYALQFVGNPYVWGGTSLTRGADCSGFVLSIYAKYGYTLPHYSGSQSNCGTRIKMSEAQPGDLIFYGNGKTISHVAIYIGNGQIVHASNRRDGIKVSSAYYRNPLKVVRILPVS